jgi:hypothetical protein
MVRGSANAAAMETTPRMPAHPNTTHIAGVKLFFFYGALVNKKKVTGLLAIPIKT